MLSLIASSIMTTYLMHGLSIKMPCRNAILSTKNITFLRVPHVPQSDGVLYHQRDKTLPKSLQCGRPAKISKQFFQ